MSDYTKRIADILMVQRPSMFDSQSPNPQPASQDDLRARGMEMLKGLMWDNLGVDYTRYGTFNDTPTQQQIQRNSPLGMSTYDYLKFMSSDMENKQQRGDSYPVDQLFPLGGWKT